MLTVHWNLANPVKTCPGIFELQHLSDPRRMASLKERYAEQKKVLQQYCYNKELIKKDGLILWNAIAIREMSKTSGQGGKPPYEGRFGDTFKGPKIALEQLSNIIRFQCEIYQHFINLARKSYQESFLGMH